MQSLSETMLRIGHPGLSDVFQSLSEAILINVQVSKNLEHESLNSMIASVLHSIPLCTGIAEWLLVYITSPGYWEVKRGTQVSNSIWKIYSNVWKLTGS